MARQLRDRVLDLPPDLRRQVQRHVLSRVHTEEAVRALVHAPRAPGHVVGARGAVVLEVASPASPARGAAPAARWRRQRSRVWVIDVHAPDSFRVCDLHRRDRGQRRWVSVDVYGHGRDYQSAMRGCLETALVGARRAVNLWALAPGRGPLYELVGRHSTTASKADARRLQALVSSMFGM